MTKTVRRPRQRRRSGGRLARRASHADGVQGTAVQPGMTGGTYKPLSDVDIQRISNTANDALMVNR